MFWIVGAEGFVQALHKISPSGLVNFAALQLTHRDWEGIRFYDLIFPLFVFLVGVSLVFSLSKIQEKEGKLATCRRIFTRSAWLYLFGIFYYGGLAQGVQDIRLLGVLQRIALCYLAAGLLYCFLKIRGLVVTCACLLVGYWAMMSFVPVPEAGPGNFQEGKNLANYIDRKYLPLRKWDGDHDPEGLLSTIPAIGTCLLGVFAGCLLRSRNRSDQQKVNFLIAAGVGGILLGHLWGIQFPVIKKIWTSSYVLVSAGYSSLFLAVFHQVLEVWKFQKWAMPFVWIGLNPFTIYMADNMVDFPKLAARIVGGPVVAMFGVYGELLIAAMVMGFSFLIAHFLYRRKIFLRL